MKPDISEIELGPHFITVWLRTSPVQLAEKMYYDFCTAYPDLADIQQDRFGHEPNDPNVYHPYGEPNEVRPEGPVPRLLLRGVRLLREPRALPEGLPPQDLLW